MNAVHQVMLLATFVRYHAQLKLTGGANEQTLIVLVQQMMSATYEIHYAVTHCCNLCQVHHQDLVHATQDGC